MTHGTITIEHDGEAITTRFIDGVINSQPIYAGAPARERTNEPTVNIMAGADPWATPQKQPGNRAYRRRMSRARGKTPDQPKSQVRP